ncbi:MAG: Gx transporter family protein [Ruthenibacterium sp.]
MKQTNTRRTALLGMLFALAMVLSFLEGSLVPLLGLPPGVKLGLANVVVMYALFFLGKADAGMLVVLKSAFSFFTRGASAGALSLAGGVLSLLVMLLLRRMKHTPSLFILSVSGAIAHNFGQLLMLQVLFTQSVYTFYYAPVLLISGLVMGSITAVSLKALIPALEKLNLKHY